MSNRPDKATPVRFNPNCMLVRNLMILPFRRCPYCEKKVKECFGIQFFIIAAAIVVLLLLMFSIRDLPVLAVEITVVILGLIALLAVIANRETDEVVINHFSLQKLYDEKLLLYEELGRSKKELEKRVKERTEELEKANRELKETEYLKAQFLANMSHELRTPLTSILGYVELLFSGRLDPKQMNALEIVRRNGKDLLRLVSDFLDLSRVQAGKMSVHKENVFVPEVVKEAIEIARQLMGRKEVKIEYLLDEKAYQLSADKDKLKHILLNLLDNAIKFSPGGTGIKLATKDTGEHVEFSVEDQGIGISPENFGLIFEKFKQVEDKPTREYRGAGLGLSIVKAFVEIQGGKIKVESEPGKGSKFVFTLPKRG